ncbi:ABC-type transporter Mla maintaining outer membrane lipid asymmetry, permease component MlaE [Mycobacterium numidiamassiliense]|uniref:ABC-type transporter Mla maintaining outer membrane lipid asymmetry, permease component MlaE n=2 Tax=Mycobacterium TaxID=1763 RepID=A0A2U3PA23_9MYCO|nr:ABC-type transporter Mla maintaining outer membrane lipid asymmetry, permease component MlaE [Mycobacterium numidiamassiliense]
MPMQVAMCPFADRVGAARMVTLHPATKPVRAMGDFFVMTAETFVTMFKPPFAWREYLLQCWFVARVSTLPGILMTIPWAVISGFLFNVLLTDIGAADFSGTGCAIFTVDQSAPIVTVLVVAGAGATAMCADLGARTIREELDAMRVMGINPIQALVVPRVLAATTVSLALASVVITAGLIGAFFCSVFLMHVSAGAWVTGLTTLTHMADVIISMVKATLFGLAAGLIACYKGISVGGGPAGVGSAVNETVVFAFIVLFVTNIIVTAVGMPFMVR